MTLQRSWVASAQAANTDFPLHNLPFGVFRDWEGDDAPRVGVAIGDRVLDVSALKASLFDGVAKRAADACAESTLNALMSLGSEYATALRARLIELLDASHADIETNKKAVQPALIAMKDAEMLLPAQIGDYTDFYASIHHATNVGLMFRPDTPLLPNYKHIPVGYHGRASSIVVSGTAIKRPQGQSKSDDAEAPSFGPTKMLDYELEMGAFIGGGNSLGEPIAIKDARTHLFGLCLVNDWSARDIQRWEYQPLGPFLAKNFGTTISPWVVTMDALEPFRARAFARAQGDPAPFPHLYDETDQTSGALDVIVEAWLESAKMRDDGFEAVRLSRGNMKNLYWTLAQMVVHHTSNGCNFKPGDLIATGTISGEEKESRGCLIERTWRGAEPLTLPTDETRTFLQDGDTVILKAYCERDGLRIGFGECRGTVSA
ncbi:MAG: fumarylacetoacetase [Candidatus Latescibacteria bacterium]|nr:fumarylacetoacetase [Candidatus Latescibacterota bacterium]